MEAEFDYIRDKDVTWEMKALTYRILQVELAFDDRTSYHWMVSPGRWKYNTYLNSLDMFPADVKVHMITGHMHPYAESLELYDHTKGQSVFKIKVENFSNRVGIERMKPYVSENGFWLRKDHQYELVSIYNNTTDKKIDAMAIMYLFYHEPTFEKTKIRKD